MLSLIAFGLTAAAALPASGEIVITLPAGATLKADAVQWGEWIADVERPQAGEAHQRQKEIGAAPAAGADGKYGAIAGMHRNDSLADAKRPQQGIDGNGQADALTDGLLIVRYNSATARAKVSKVDSFSIKQKALTAPRPSGAVQVKLPQPWPACAVGDRFNGVYLTIGATHKYRLEGLEVARCSAEKVAFVYAKAQAE